LTGGIISIILYIVLNIIKQMTEQLLEYPNSEPNIEYPGTQINFKKKQNLQKNILIMEAEIKTDKIIYLLFYYSRIEKKIKITLKHLN
jgi:hypothetical protein